LISSDCTRVVEGRVTVTTGS